MNKSEFNAYFQKKATPWVSYFVLIGCACITLMLVYASQQAMAVGSEWGNNNELLQKHLNN